MNKEILHFKTSSGIKSIVGKDLITDKFVAIFELVKNSYDANASTVKIIFLKDKIIIKDNGQGMSKDDLVNKWLNLAYSEKKEGAANNDRAFVGSKGIGRFSADRLGKKLTIKTKHKGSKNFHQLDVDWTKFDLDLRNLFETVEINYQENKSEKVDESYTYLEISELNEIWNLEQIHKAKESLRRLKNPFIKDDGFKIIVINKINLIPEEESIESNIAEVLKDKSITIQASFHEKIEITLFDRGVKIYQIEKENDSILKNCPININVNYLTYSSKLTFTRRMKVEPVNYGNIFIYKNNFRVMPYGERDYDLFSLNMRKTQGHSRYLGTRELLGFFDIKDINNKFFKEASSRDSGFVNNIYLKELEELYLSLIHRPLESYVNLISWGEVKFDEFNDSKEIFFENVNLDEVEKFRKYISRNKKLIYFKSGMSFDENKPEKQLERLINKTSKENKSEVELIVKNVNKKLNEIKKESIDKEKIVFEKNKDIELLKRQNRNLSLKRSEASYAEQLNHHLTLYSKRLNSVVDKLVSIEEEIESVKLKKDLRERIRTIKRTSSEMTVFRDILSKSNLDTKSPQTLSWVDLLSWHIENTQFSIKVSLVDETQKSDIWCVKSNIVEYILMIDNFINNAEEHNASLIEFEFNDNEILVKSNSSAIDENNLEKVFELGFSTKNQGTGIGLSQVKSFLKKVNMSISVTNINSLVCFLIKKTG